MMAGSGRRQKTKQKSYKPVRKLGVGGQPPVRNKRKKMQNVLKRKNIFFYEKVCEIYSFGPIYVYVKKSIITEIKSGFKVIVTVDKYLTSKSC